VLRLMVVGNDPVNCSVSYTAPTGPNISPVYDLPRTTGC